MDYESYLIKVFQNGLCVRFINLRIESAVKIILGEISEKSGLPLSDIIRDIIWIGIGIQEKGGVTIHGPFGLKLPFARITFGRRDARVNIYVEEEQIDEVVRLFKINNYNAIGAAIKLGLVPLDLDSFRITGFFGASRPLTNVEVPELENKKSVESYKRIKDLLEKSSDIDL